MIAKIIVAFLLMILLIILMHGSITGIRGDDKIYAEICSIAVGPVAFLFGFVLGSLVL